MVCPECGSVLKEGHVYCESCGKEIQIVPDFDPEIEASMHETLHGIVEEITLDDNKAQKQDTTPWEQTKKNANKTRIYTGSVLGGALVFILLICLSIYLINNNSYNYQLRKSQECSAIENYKEAITYMEKAVSLDPKQKEARLQLANLYLKNLEENKALALLQELVKEDPTYAEAYKRIIAIYETRKDYLAIQNLLEGCKDDTILQQFQYYIANPPEFSIEEGEYTQIIALKLITPANGNAYYTLNGTEPDENSSIYKSPIFLENGIYVVTAKYINEYGIASESIAKTYRIEIEEPTAPDVLLESGEYEKPQMITVDVPYGSSVYYTLDGSMPTKDSTPYLGPIAMPLGKTTFRFIMYNDEDISGDVAEMKYQLNLAATLSVQDAINFTKTSLMERGSILDIEGHVLNMVGNNSYTCTSAFTLDDQVFYLILEYYEDALGTRSKTGNTFAVNVESGQLYRATTNYEGYYVVEAF